MALSKALSQYYPDTGASSDSGCTRPDNFIKRTLRGENRRKVRLERVLTVRHFQKAQVLQVSWATCVKNADIDRGRKYGDAKHKEANMVRSVSRSKAQMRRDMLSIGVDRMITLTYASNMQDRGKAIRDRQEFDRRMRRAMPSWFGVAVLERQKRGAWHWHIAVRGFYDVRIVRALWQRTIREKARVHIGWSWDQKGNCYTKLASYMAKYMGKDLENSISEKHRYHTSGDVDRPRETYTVPLLAPRGTEQQIAFELAVDLVGRGEGIDAYVCPRNLPNSAGYAAFSKSQTTGGPT